MSTQNLNPDKQCCADHVAKIIILSNKIGLLKQLMLLTHESVSNEVMSVLQAKQWREFTRQFPDEGTT